jgi:hypothetical protein
MVNPRFAAAVLMFLVVFAAIALYSVFGTTLAGMIQPAQPTAALQATQAAATNAPLPTNVPQDVPPAGNAQEPVATSTPAGQVNAEPTVPATAAPPTAVPPTAVPPTKEPPTEVPATPTPIEGQFSRTVDGKYYDAYVDAATKLHQYYHYTCEFDAAWVVLKTDGIDVTLDDQIAIVGLDTSIEPTYEETPDGFIAHGGDILNHYSGDYTSNFLARSTGNVIRRIFEHYGLKTTAVHDRASLEAALRSGQLVWIKTTADFKPGKPLKWIMPDGTTYDTVLGNDHAAVVMGYSDRGALIRDVLGPTSTNENRTYEYEVDWDTFMAAWGQQQYDGIAVGK